MSAATFTLEVDTGLPLHMPLQLMESSTIPYDLTGCSFTAGIRPQAGAEPYVPVTVSITAAEQGEILLRATAEELRVLTARSHAWDLILTDTEGVKTVLLRGPVKLNGVIAI